MDVAGADTQGAIGYAIQQNLYNHFLKLGIQKSAVTVVTQVEVDPNDPAMQNPSKPIGRFMNKRRAQQRRRERGWDIAEDAGRGWRRVVPSPLPQRIIEEEIIKNLIASGAVVIAVGGGGIPVIANEEGSLRGIAAVIDKDYASALLATDIGADLFIISTGIEKVAINYGKPEQQWLDHLTLDQAKAYLAEGKHFAKGSMAPKIQAVINFLENGGQKAIITNPENIERAVAGETGTHITI
jgi:carbamate kinase